MMSTDSGFWPESVMVGEVVYPPGGSFGPRMQYNLQLVLIHTGDATVWIDGIEKRANANTIFVLFPGHEECFAFAKECETMHSWVHIYLPQFDRELLERLRRLAWPLPLSAVMHQLMREALAIQKHSFSTSQEMLKTLSLALLWRYLAEGEAQETRTNLVVHPVVELAQQHILAHLDESLTLEAIASAVAISPAHLIRLFQLQMQTTPIAYLWQQRVSLGVRLLEQTGLTVSMIAERCGFQSRFHFSRRIRQAVGMTPLEVRRRAWQPR